MPDLKTLSQNLRKNQTEPELKFWYHVRRKQLNNLKFRRQVPIDKYIVDFLCFEKRLIIEIDGGQHADNIEYDAQRTKDLNEKGFIVLRFWNNDVMNNIEGVLEEIINTVNPLPSPPPYGEGKDEVK